MRSRLPQQDPLALRRKLMSMQAPCCVRPPEKRQWSKIARRGRQKKKKCSAGWPKPTVGSYVATYAEVSVLDDSTVKIPPAVAATDWPCGGLWQIESAQVEGSLPMA
jgi:hypothetical protein